MSLKQDCTPSIGTVPALKPSQVPTFIWLTVMVLLWGLSWPATKLALVEVPPLWLAAIRFGSASVCLFVFVALRGDLRLPGKQDLPIVASMGLLQMMAFTGLGMIAMTQTDTSKAVLLAYTTPIWAVFMGWLLFRQSPTRMQLGALAIGLAGVALICSPLEMDWRKAGTITGCVFLLLAAICWSVVILHIRRHRWASTPLSLAPWQMLLATIPLAVIAYGVEGVPSALPHDSHILALLFFIGPVATSACFVISAEFGRRISVFAMSNFTLGVPLIGIAASVAFLGNKVVDPLRH
ncbi:DMT family transporter [Neorhizobium sp. NCHU2750]|uniref:DMT family transporter n=1 Tax=Neorhizobium sp. NCHU2750 TaxID=1825976 RepID=UPI000EB6BBFB|nr:membrane protein [Neorhizobium sp. NCHU2750]